MKISICIPTIGREGRVERLINFYSLVNDINLEIVFSHSSGCKTHEIAVRGGARPRLTKKSKW